MTDLLKEEKATLKRLQLSATHRANSGSIFAPLHKKEAEHLQTIIDYLQLNGETLKRCVNCGTIFNGNSTKSFCCDKCRMTFNYKKNKNNEE